MGDTEVTIPVLAQRPVKPAASAQSQHGGGQIQRRRVRVERRHRTPPQHQFRVGDVAPQRSGADLTPGRLLGRCVQRAGGRGPVPVGRPCELESLGPGRVTR